MKIDVYTKERERFLTSDISFRIKDLHILNNFRPFYDLFLIYLTTILLTYLLIKIRKIDFFIPKNHIFFIN